MSGFHTKILLQILTLLLTMTGCVKFEDPALSESPAVISNNSPCHTELSNNISEISNSASGSTIDSFSFSNATCSETIINGNVSNGSFVIILGSPITQNATFQLKNFIIEDYHAKMQFYLPGLSFSEVISQSGMLYAQVENNGDIALEWCDVPCWPVAGGTVLYSGGRMICD